jgi:Uma2 family endonuclease
MEKKPDKVWTYDDLIAMGEYPDGKKFEIFDGELVVSPSPVLWHQEVLKRIFRVFDADLEAKRLAKVYFAPLDVVLSWTKVVQPDLLVVRWERRSIFERRGFVSAAPDLVVEVVSPSNTRHDRVRKRRFYARNQIPEYWIVEPEDKTIEVLALIDGGLSYRQVGWYGPGDRVESATFTLAFDLDPIFAEDDPESPEPSTAR